MKRTKTKTRSASHCDLEHTNEGMGKKNVWIGVANARTVDINQGDKLKGEIVVSERLQAELMYLNMLPAKFKEADVNSDGVVSMDEFVDIYKRFTGKPPPRSHIAKFKKCDKDNSGSISLREFLQFQQGGNSLYKFASQLPKAHRIVGGSVGSFRPDLKLDVLRRVSALERASRKAKAIAKKAQN